MLLHSMLRAILPAPCAATCIAKRMRRKLFR
jgi:hypothetical protein